MNTEQFETLISMCRYLGIQVLLFGKESDEAAQNETYINIEEIDYGFRKKMLKDFDYRLIQDLMEKYLEEGIYYLYEDDLNLHYSLFRIPEEYVKEAGCRILCIGPILYQPVSRHVALELIEKLNVSPHYQQDFMEYFNRIPLVPYFDMWNHLIGFFLTRCGFSLDFRLVNNDTLKIFPHYDYHYLIPETPEVALMTIAERYKWENAMLDAVSSGNIQQAMEAHYQFLQYRLLPRTADALRDRKNIMFTFNTLLRKAVEHGHVHPLHIDNLSQQFAIQIESAPTIEKLVSLSTTMLRRYCMLVNNYSRRSYSIAVRTCMDYIDFHYDTDITLASLADMCFVSSSYLSAQFKKESGITITDYISRTRIRQALTLLNTTQLSIGEIASQCGFADANYFTRIFKKNMGKSPKEYRNEIQKEFS